MEIDILYEDEYVLALDKPSGLLVHADGRTEELTLVDWINEKYPALKDVGEPQTLQNGAIIKRPGIVHRLDKETSGVIIVAKTSEAHQFLKGQFQNRKIHKIYNAVVWGNFSEEKMGGTINKPIGRSTGDFRKWSAEYGAKGEMREAMTEYKVLAQGPHPSLRVDPLPTEAVQSLDFFSKNLNDSCESSKYSDSHLDKERVGRGLPGFSYLEVKPKTGRTHQIRVHLKSISHPVVCDKLYGPARECSPETCLGFDRLALHALSIKLELPSGTHLNIESPLPEEFENAKNILKNG